MITMTSIEKVEKNFHELIRYFLADEIAEKGTFRFPEITGENARLSGSVMILGMFGGINYSLREDGEKPLLYATAFSRMDMDVRKYLVDEDSYRLIEKRD